MENASRALIMAAGVLIGMAILSLAIYLIMSFGASTSETYQRVEEQRLMEFNAQFNVYEGENATVYDIVTVVNLAKENNLKEEKQITVFLGSDNITDKEQDELINLIKNNTNVNSEAEILNKFNCDISYENGRVNKVIFTTN